MKITIEVHDELLPPSFKNEDGTHCWQNIADFLYESLILRTLDKRNEERSRSQYCEAFYTKQGLDGKAYVEAIERVCDDEYQLGRLLCDNIIKEQANAQEQQKGTPS